MLQREQELAQLEIEIAQLQKQITAVNAQAEQGSQQLNQIEAQYENQQQQLRDIVARVAELGAKFKVQQNILEQKQERDAVIAREQKELQQQAEECQNELLQVRTCRQNVM